MITPLAPLAAPVVITASAATLPNMQRPTLPFGVRIPAERTDHPVVTAQIRGYRLKVLACGVLALAVSGGLGWATGGTTLIAVPILLLLALVAVCYLTARRAILRAKSAEGWYAEVRQAVAVDTTLRTAPERFPWWWATPVALVPVATLALGIAAYPSMPAMVAVHSNGVVVDRWQHKSPFVVAVPVFVQVLLGLLIVGLLLWSFRSRPDLDAASPRRSSAQHRLFLRRISRAMLLVGACADLSLLLVLWPMWQGHTPDGWSSAAAVLIVVLSTVGLVVVAVRTGQGGSRIAVDEEPERTGVAQRDDDRHWRLGGTLYVNRDDPAILVQKRVGIGWTLNWGNTRGVAIFLGSLAVFVGLVVAATTLT